jgi:serine/threonine protein kinase
VDNEGNVKITDFGLTFWTDNTGPHTGPIDGSFRWMAPELYQILNGDNDLSEKWEPTFKTDVYSFAHTIVEVFSPLLNTETETEIFQRRTR